MQRWMTAILLAVLMLTAAAGAYAEPITGGWSVAEDNTISDEASALLSKALEGLVGVTYTPISYLGSQVVAGFNHCFLCKAAAVAPNAEPKLVLLYVYEGLTGNVEILDIVDVRLGAEMR
ncbi:MAG: hypothetical protein ACI4PG_05145 [Candidatus Ventricola sp.]